MWNQRAINYGQGAAQMARENAQLAAASRQQAQSGALILQTSPDEFYIVGINVSFSFSPKKEGAAEKRYRANAGSDGCPPAETARTAK